jgi:hypothetical protein
VIAVGRAKHFSFFQNLVFEPFSCTLISPGADPVLSLVKMGRIEKPKKIEGAKLKN